MAMNPQEIPPGIKQLLVVQNAVAELHAHLIPQLATLANNMIRDLDPKVCFGSIHTNFGFLRSMH